MYSRHLDAFLAEDKARAQAVLQGGMVAANNMIKQALTNGTQTQKVAQLALLRVIAIELIANQIFSEVMNAQVSERESVEASIVNRFSADIADRLSGMKSDIAKGAARLKTVKLGGEEAPKKAVKKAVKKEAKKAPKKEAKKVVKPAAKKMKLKIVK